MINESDIIDLNHELSVNAFQKLVFSKKRPPLNELEVLDILRNNGLKNTADYIHSLL